jgi:hypothetical protein
MTTARLMNMITLSMTTELSRVMDLSKAIDMMKTTVQDGQDGPLRGGAVKAMDEDVVHKQAGCVQKAQPMADPEDFTTENMVHTTDRSTSTTEGLTTRPAYISVKYIVICTYV